MCLQLLLMPDRLTAGCPISVGQPLSCLSGQTAHTGAYRGLNRTQLLPGQPTAPAGAGDRICIFPIPTGIPVSRSSQILPPDRIWYSGRLLRALIYLDCPGHHVAPRADWNNAFNKRGNDH